MCFKACCVGVAGFEPTTPCSQSSSTRALRCLMLIFYVLIILDLQVICSLFSLSITESVSQYGKSPFIYSTVLYRLISTIDSTQSLKHIVAIIAFCIVCFDIHYRFCQYRYLFGWPAVVNRNRLCKFKRVVPPLNTE